MFKGVAKKWNIKINDSDCEVAQTLTTTVEELLNKALEGEDDAKDRWRKQLEKDIPELEKQARTIQESIEAEQFDI